MLLYICNSFSWNNVCKLLLFTWIPFFLIKWLINTHLVWILNAFVLRRPLHWGQIHEQVYQLYSFQWGISRKTSRLAPASQLRSCDLRYHMQAVVSLSFLTCKIGVVISLGCSRTRRYLHEVQWMVNMQFSLLLVLYCVFTWK